MEKTDACSRFLHLPRPVRWLEALHPRLRAPHLCSTVRGLQGGTVVSLTRRFHVSFCWFRSIVLDSLKPESLCFALMGVVVGKMEGLICCGERCLPGNATEQRRPAREGTALDGLPSLSLQELCLGFGLNLNLKPSTSKLKQS